MKAINICYIPNTDIYERITKNQVKNTETGYFTQNGTEYDTIYISSSEQLQTIFESHSFDLIMRIIYISLGRLHIASHINNGDIMLPNTFLSKTSGDALYVDYAVGEYYDLEKFVLHLDGVCVDQFSEVSEEYDGDIEEKNVYDFLLTLVEKGLKDKGVVILGTEENTQSYERISAITDMMCSD